MMQIGSNDKMFEFVYVISAASTHILVTRALVLTVQGADGESYFVTDVSPQPFFDFFRKCYAAVGHPVAPEEVKALPFWLVRIMASVGEWAYWIFMVGMVNLKLRKQKIEHLDSRC
ncbi:hypothetical protein K469DRAFT_301053 [Zopfia rhizophila CBS 207.26]|uniref:3-beta hydroxysteroid dehydrogenase/isomerase domain-containing protein n=1 Tax=Zopfia rhizophila CBS 207.26 TaxID=1314779 RepID=A0A6A6DPF4_9PEZI|nr:hypothetical protein K469DRAFT_301053 [Zopfia rhizophila CBS 207.26]